MPSRGGRGDACALTDGRRWRRGAQGEALMQEPIDLEWLDVEWGRVDRLYAAEAAAQKQGERMLPVCVAGAAGAGRRSVHGCAAVCAERALRSGCWGLRLPLRAGKCIKKGI